MTRLEELLLLILDRAQKMGMKDLSSFQLFKIPYVIQVFSMKYAGKNFLPHTVFVREKNGPISIDIYSAVDNLVKLGYIGLDVSKKTDYPFPRHGHRLAKKLPKLSLSKGEIIFLDNFLSELLPLSQKKLKDFAYATEPMREILKDEEKGIKKGAVLNFSTVTVDSDVVDAYADAV